MHIGLPASATTDKTDDAAPQPSPLHACPEDPCVIEVGVFPAATAAQEAAAVHRAQEESLETKIGDDETQNSGAGMGEADNSTEQQHTPQKAAAGDGDCGQEPRQTLEELLQQLTASAIESCRGAELDSPRCYLRVLGFRSAALETAYAASNAPSVSAGHRIFSSFHGLYVVMRLLAVMSGDNTITASSALTVYCFCSHGLAVVLSIFCWMYFSGREVELRESLARVGTAAVLLAFSGWVAQDIDILYNQTNDQWSAELVLTSN